MIKLKRFGFPIILVTILMLVAFLTVTNYTKVQRLEAEGIVPVTFATPGASGRDGARGPAGPNGDIGPQGAPGEDGKDGEAGAQGTPGSDGADGLNGARGTDGAQGPKGDKGDRGDVGSSAPIVAPACGRYVKNNTPVYISVNKVIGSDTYYATKEAGRFSPWQCPNYIEITEPTN